MSSAREYFTIELRGLRAALAAEAAERGLSLIGGAPPVVPAWECVEAVIARSLGGQSSNRKCQRSKGFDERILKEGVAEPAGSAKAQVEPAHQARKTRLIRRMLSSAPAIPPMKVEAIVGAAGRVMQVVVQCRRQPPAPPARKPRARHQFHAGMAEQLDRTRPGDPHRRADPWLNDAGSVTAWKRGESGACLRRGRSARPAKVVGGTSCSVLRS